MSSKSSNPLPRGFSAHLYVAFTLGAVLTYTIDLILGELKFKIFTYLPVGRF